VRLTEPVRVLHPVYALGSFRGCGVDVDVTKDNISRIHHVNRPELGLDDVEVADVDVADVP